VLQSVPVKQSGLLTEGVRTARVARLLFWGVERLYSLGLGRLVGHRFLRLTHVGRKSGRIHHTLVEVITYDLTSRESVVLSGWGERADWYRNIRANPPVQVATGADCYTPVCRFLDSSELYERLQIYVARNRAIRAIVLRALGLLLDGSEADRAQFERHDYRGVAFRPG
jgi:deazaflavin-dependent oxidoreductase (nitroreductase family)